MKEKVARMILRFRTWEMKRRAKLSKMFGKGDKWTKIRKVYKHQSQRQGDILYAAHAV